MKELAVDFVLLPHEDVMIKLVELNNLLRRDYTRHRIVLDEEKCFPHISLLMGSISRENVDKVKEKLIYLSEKFMPISLGATDFTQENLPAKEEILKISGLKIKKSQRLKNLHTRIIDEMKPYLVNPEINADMMYNPREIDSLDTPWMFHYIKKFIRNSSYENFNPHITIGDGILEQKLKLPMKFVSSRLAVAHLGNYCTCREIL